MIKRLFLVVVALMFATTALRAQNTFGVTAGYGSAKTRIYPSMETKSVYGLYSSGISWRHYTAERFLGCFGIDFEYIQRGFAYAPYTIDNNHDGDNKDKELLYYTRNINSLMLPIIFQPYTYAWNNHLRIFGEAGTTISYDLNSSYRDDLSESYGNVDDWQGEYNYRTERDNRWGYGLTFGAGIAVLVKQLELSVSARYYFGYSDVVKSRTKYYDNSLDTTENPFSYSPIRSPLDNIMFRFGVSYRFNKEGFDAWNTKRLKSGKLGGGFDYEK